MSHHLADPTTLGTALSNRHRKRPGIRNPAVLRRRAHGNRQVQVYGQVGDVLDARISAAGLTAYRKLFSGFALWPERCVGEAHHSVVCYAYST